MVEWGKHFEISESSRSGLVWYNDRFTGTNLNVVIARKGDLAGSLNSQGYWMVYAVDIQKSVPCHRVIYEMLHGPLLPGEQVDHKDGDRANNSPHNLRKVSCALNSRNQKIRVVNKEG